MKLYKDYSKEELVKLKEELQKEYEGFQKENLKLDMSRGKPSKEQIGLSSELLTIVDDYSQLNFDGREYGNYGLLDGIPEAKKLMGSILGLPSENVFVGGNSSLNLIHDVVSFAHSFGVRDGKPWSQQEVKFLCPSPGYDRHFFIAEHFGFELLTVDMDENGPIMEQVEEYVKDPTVKGIMCVPKYSNPTGITYSDDVVKALATMETAADDFIIIWDNAYSVHHLDFNDPHVLAPLSDELKKAGNEDRGIQFTSTSKITFPGGGISAIGASDANMAWLKKHYSKQTIGFDKINQLRHARFLPDYEAVENLMKKHGEFLRPKFAVVDENLKPLKEQGIADYAEPKGGYFICLEVDEGCAKRVVELCKNAGVIMTPAGATHPYEDNPKDNVIRVAPTYPTIDELSKAAELLALAVKLAYTEKHTA